MDLEKPFIDALPLNIPMRVLYFVLSYLILCFGISLGNRCGLPITPTDLFPREMADITKLPYARVKITFDLTCLITTAVITFVGVGAIRGLASALWSPPAPWAKVSPLSAACWIKD